MDPYISVLIIKLLKEKKPKESNSARETIFGSFISLAAILIPLMPVTFTDSKKS